MELNGIVIFIRWVHIFSACIAVGTAYFAAVIWSPSAQAALDTDASASRSLRRGLKMTVHTVLLLLLLTGAYNAIRNWPIYTSQPGIMHGLFGLHLLLGLGGLTLLILVWAGREMKPAAQQLARWSLLLLAVGIACGGTLKSAREWASSHAKTTAAARP